MKDALSEHYKQQENFWVDKDSILPVPVAARPKA